MIWQPHAHIHTRRHTCACVHTHARTHTHLWNTAKLRQDPVIQGAGNYLISRYCRFTKAQQSCTSTLAEFMRWEGIRSRILNSFSLTFTFSTWMQFLEISLVAFTSHSVNFPLLRKGGLFTMTPSDTMSEINNPLSAKMRLPAILGVPECQTAALCTYQTQSLEEWAAKIGHTFGATEMSTLNECIPLYFE